MGGFGSGEWRWRTKTLVEECRSIDIRRWKRDGLLVPGNLFVWAWWDDKGTRTASINVKVHDDYVCLDYKRRAHLEDWEEVQEPVPLSTSACNFGGERVWFICPGSVNDVPCRRRVAMLYAAGRYFLCRHCYRLAYRSSRERPFEAHRRKAQTIRRRLGGTGSLFDPIPQKPKGMHDTTYVRLRRELCEHERRYFAESDEWSHARFMRLMDK